MLARTLGARLAPRLGASRNLSTASLQHVKLDVTESGVAMLRLDCQGEKQNTLSRELMDEMEVVVKQVETDPKVKAVVLISDKQGSFIAGANIKMVEDLGKKSASDAGDASAEGQVAMDKIASMQKTKPWVAAIDGPCLGGGLEVALACSQRVATASSKTTLGLPEVMLGLLPGAGGTQRLPKLVGAAPALDMMLTGKMIKAARAKKMGLVDLVVDANALERSAVATALDLAAGKAKAKQRKKGWMDTLLEGNPLGRKVMFDKAKEQVMKATKGKMPAPLNIIECVKAGLEGGHSSGSKVEARRFGELAASSESAALRGLFFGQTAAKKNVFGQPPKRVETVGVLGAGLMGAGIAEVSAAKDIRVLLKDQNVAGLSRGEGQIKKNLDGKHKKKRISTYERDAMLSRVTGLTDNDSAWAKHFGQADMVIEAVFEDMAVKHKVVAEMEAVLPPHAIIASNTSTLPIGEIAAKAARPENIVGMHYFSPVDKMPLLEVIPHAGTSKEVCAAAVDVGLRQGKTVIAVKDVPGFYVNRCLGPCMVEACALLQQGADPQKLNEAMPKAGYPVGVLSLCDEVGIDVANKVVGNLIGEQPKFLGVRMEGADLGMLKAFVDKGLLGRKAGAGFYDYSVKEKKKPINKAALDVIAQFRDASNSSAEGLGLDELNERLMLRFVKEAVHCLESGVIETAREGDIGAVFGVGFPPFLGGPFMYVDAVGAKTVVAAMDRLAAQHGEQFAPPDLLKKHADEGKPFHA